MNEIVIPNDFLWGASTSAYQIEGAIDVDGKGQSVWDTFCKRPNAIARGESGERACEHYFRMDEDIVCMHELGLRAYRFSLSWPRIMPEGRGHVEQRGIDFYKRLLDRLHEYDILPFLTLHHWDMPQDLFDMLGGWQSDDLPRYFADFADVVFRSFGDRVRHWVTLNEANGGIAREGYEHGTNAPGLCLPRKQIYAINHRLIRAHSYAYEAFAASDASGEFGIVMNLAMMYPKTRGDDDLKASERSMDYDNFFWIDPIFKGRFPTIVEDDAIAAYMPDGYDDDLRRLKGTADFLGVNYYSSWITHAKPDAFLAYDGERPKLPTTSMGWPIAPDGLYDLLGVLSKRYPETAFYITENGAAFDDVVSEDGAVHDAARTIFLQKHIREAIRALAEGVDLRGYFVWSFIDNFEWAEGYAKRFGLVYVDYETQERIIKDSGRWFAKFIRNPFGYAHLQEY